MRNLAALLALLAFMPTANAGSEVIHSGEYRVRSINLSNKGGVDGAAMNEIEHDFRWNVNFKANDKFGANLVLLHDTNWGEDMKTVAASPNQKRMDATTQDNLLRVVEAYGTWMATDELSFRFGRGAFDMADGRVVSTEYNTTPNSFEGIIGMYDAEVARVSFFGVKGYDLDTLTGDQTTSDDEINFYGLAYDAKGLPDVLKTAHFHFIKVAGQESGTGAVPARDEMRYGIVLGGDAAGVDYRLTYEMQGGSQGLATKTDQKGTMADLEVGYSMPDVMNLRFFVGYHMDSGDDDATDTDNKHYDGFYYNKWDNGGIMRNFDWGNLTYIHAGAKLDPMDELTVGLDFYQFSLTESKDKVTGAMFSSLAANAARTESGLGQEIDLWATHKYGENFAITAAYSMFTPNDTNFSTMKETVSQIFIEGNMTF